MWIVSQAEYDDLFRRLESVTELSIVRSVLHLNRRNPPTSDVERTEDFKYAVNAIVAVAGDKILHEKELHDRLWAYYKTFRTQTTKR